VSEQRPEAGVEYAGFPTDEYRAHGRREAVLSLARAWDITETRAAACLAHPGEFRAEYRSRMTPQQRLRELERRYLDPSLVRSP
jgi:hypothetical protein